MKIGYVEAIREVGPEMPERRSKTSKMPVVWETFGFFSARIKLFSVAIGDHGRNLVISLWQQSTSQWSGGITDHPNPKNSEWKKSAGKFLASIFWDPDGILLINYLPKGQTINAQYYLSLSIQLRNILKEKRRGKFTKMFLFLHDNVPSHRVLATQKKLAYLGFQCLDHPPYSPDLAPSDYHLFPGPKKQLKGNHFSSDAKVISAAETWLDGQFSDFFLSFLQKL